MEKKSYGVLMERHMINECICIYHPVYLIQGRDTKEGFEDTMKDLYVYSTDAEDFYAHETGLSVAYIISEEELLKENEGVSLEEAKMAYFSNISQSVHVGYYMGIENKVILESYGVEDLFERLKNVDEQTAKKFSIKSSKSYHLVDNEKDAIQIEELIPITVSDFRKMLDIREDAKLRVVLQRMYEQFENGQLPVTLEMDEKEIYPSLENQEITGKKIVSFFIAICNKMITANSMEQISTLENNLQAGFMNVVLLLDSHGEEDIPTAAAEEIFYRIKDEISMITASRDITRIKVDIADVLKRETEEVRRAATIYDEYDTKYKKSLEMSVKTPKRASNKNNSPFRMVNARSLKAFFDRRIAGQEEAKKTIISAVVMNGLSEVSSDRISCFLVGPPGSGKTLIAETLGEYLDVPYEIIDSTQITSPGYVGRDIEDSLARLIRKAGGDVEKAESGIVVFNELDKKGSDKKSDIAGQAVLNCLLSFFEGTTYQVKKGTEKVDFNTSNLTIFATGACTDVARAKLQKEGLGPYKKMKIGFASDLSDTKDEEDFVYPELEPEDFVKYGGMTDEIIGRITTICQLSGHTAETLKFILTNIETSTLLLLQQKLLKLGIDLRWTEDYLDAVAHKAIKLKTGARSLKSTVEKSVQEARWEVLMNPNKYSSILLTAECVENPMACKLVDMTGRIFTVSELNEQEVCCDEKVKKIGAAETI